MGGAETEGERARHRDDLTDCDEAIAGLVRQILEQHGVDDAEDGRVRADAERERQDDSDAEGRLTAHDREPYRTSCARPLAHRPSIADRSALPIARRRMSSQHQAQAEEIVAQALSRVGCAARSFPAGVQLEEVPFDVLPGLARTEQAEDDSREESRTDRPERAPGRRESKGRS